MLLTLTKLSRNRPSFTRILSATLLLFFLGLYASPASTWSREQWQDSIFGVTPANETLGFGGIFPVVAVGSPRRKALLERAAVTELNLTIPEQVVWTDEDVRRFRIFPEDKSSAGRGSVTAWLSHHVALRAFLDSGLETGLILEDDVDWDIRLRTYQIPIAQREARSIFDTNRRDAGSYPWGRPEGWDLLCKSSGEPFPNNA